MTDTLIEQCNVPPKGWICQRGKGHAGPCAANPLPDGMTEGQYWYSRWWDAVADDEAAQAIATLTAELQELRLELITNTGQTQTALEGKAALTAENERLREALEVMIPKGICLTNKNIPDSMTVPLETTMGELRQMVAALAAIGDE